MYNVNKPDASELPSTSRLLKSTGIAVVVASAVLVTAVLPAEYGVDPTRIGSLLGLTEMGRIKQQLAAEAEAEAAGTDEAAPMAATPATPATASPAADVAPVSQPGQRTDETVLTLAPDQGAEIKLVMAEGARVRFTWTSSGGRINYDTHADRPGTPYHGYGKGSEQRVEGELVAAFDGSHGWFWRNRTGEPVTITLETSGAYSEVKRVV
ncbi:transmembrane anchor protein [Brevundimonas fontaquae]|uniref:Transmembrane anchor protein n=1 Tax=Brevundimonas fontaquae TaxID=2813778 RepID=A0ABX7LJ58_9CAUL|nr:transmembrane anchor protein [Brevundimonas fontaquae]QSF52847.1 transmembrane anchor protein [Brevundimonas fontaquae]